MLPEPDPALLRVVVAPGQPGASFAADAADAADTPTGMGDARQAPFTISIQADGSSHGGRRFFDGGGAEEWARAVGKERALEQRSPGGGAHPARGGDTTAGQAALRLEALPDVATQRNGGVWLVEDGGAKGGAPLAGQPPGGGAKGFGGAVVVVEEPDERELFDLSTYLSSLPKKLKGGLDSRLPVPPWRDVFWSWLGAFLGILAVSTLNQWATPEIDIAFVVGSFGASAVLVFALLESKMSQPRNFLGGQMISALVGITTRVIIHEAWIAGPVGMSLALVAMQLTATTHPPGGATALIACTLPTLPRWHGYSYLVTIGVGSLAMQLIALVVNNLDPRRRYPTFWW